MKLAIKARKLKGSLTVPGDKSISHRSVMFGAIAYGKTRVKNILQAEDVFSTIHAFRALGVSIKEEKDTLIIEGNGFEGLKAPKEPINLGNSGTTIRLLSGILAGSNFSTVFFGDKSLNKRPMDRIAAPLRLMNVTIKGKGDKETPPLTIIGNPQLKAIDYQMPISSAQVKSALLFAAMQAQGVSTIIEKERSRNHTEEMIELFGGEISINGKVIRLNGGQKLKAQDLSIPADISSAAFFLVAGLIVPESKITLENVELNQTRTGILDVFTAMQADVQIEKTSGNITVSTSTLQATTIEGALIPRLIDELPIIALLATQAHGTTIIKDAQELKVKESNRIDAVAMELGKMGADITATADGMIIQGPTKLHAANVDSHGDHRIGMMLAIATLLVEDGEVNLANAQIVNISYPNFFKDLAYLRGEQ